MRPYRTAAALPLERMSDPLQEVYAELRNQYPRAAINLVPEDGVITVTFDAGPTVRVTETKGGQFRVKATRTVPAGKKTKEVEQAKTAKDARAVLYAIDGFLVESEPRTAAAPVAYEKITHAFLNTLGAHPEQLSSSQLGERLSRFIRTGLPTQWDPSSVTFEMWQDVGRLLGEHGIHIDDRDLNAAIDRTS